MSAPWNRWFHCIGGTYGSWLPGDPRGFRTRHHREHVEGDYRNPPPAGIYETRHRQAEDSLRFDPVTLHPDDRRIVCHAMAQTLLAYGVELVEMSVGGQHFHALCRFPVELPAGEVTIRLRGKIDRVDLVGPPEGAQPLVVVVGVERARWLLDANINSQLCRRLFLTALSLCP